MRRDTVMSKYGCVRYLSLPWAKTVRQAAVDGFTADGEMTVGFLQKIKEKVLIERLDNITTGTPPDVWPALEAIAHDTTLSAAIHGAWQHYGRQIFELSPKLVAAFRLTDVTHSSFEGLHFPYRAFFIHFGAQRDLVIESDLRGAPRNVDGAYVWLYQTTIVIEFSLFCRDDPHLNLPGIQIQIDPGVAGLGAEEAINRSIDSMIEKIGGNVLRTQEPNLNQEVAYQNARFLDDARDVLRQTATLISNSLFYLSEPHDDLIVTVEEGAPQSLIDRALNGTPAQQRKAKQSLAADGYAVIRYCGGRFSLPGDDGNGAGETIGSHWRRGHWRNQPYGPRLSQIKRIWIRPVLVNAHSGEPDRGRIYIVGEDPDHGA